MQNANDTTTTQPIPEPEHTTAGTDTPIPHLTQTDPSLTPNNQDPAALLAPESAPEHHKVTQERYETLPGQTSPVEQGSAPDPDEELARQTAYRYAQAQEVEAAHSEPAPS